MPGSADDVQVDHGRELPDVLAQEVEGGRRGGAPGRLVADPAHLAQPAGQQLVGAILDDRGDLRAGWAAVGRVVLEPAVLGRIVRRGDHDPVGQAVVAPVVVDEDGPGQRGRRRVPVPAVHQHGDLVGRQDLQRGHERGLGQAVGVPAEEQRAGGARPGPVVTDGLGGGGDVILVERGTQRRAAVSRRAEADLLLGDRRIRMQRVVGRDQFGHVHQVRLAGQLAGPLVHPQRQLLTPQCAQHRASHHETPRSGHPPPGQRSPRCRQCPGSRRRVVC